MIFVEEKWSLLQQNYGVLEGKYIFTFLKSMLTKLGTCVYVSVLFLIVSLFVRVRYDDILCYKCICL